MKRTKIVCTLGPVSTKPKTIREMIQAGMDVARINLSHGTHEEHKERIRLVRSIAGEMQKEIGILADLQGPKIRTGKLPEPMDLKEGMRLCLRWAGVGAPPPAGVPVITVDYPHLAADLETGSMIYLRDGLLHLRVEKILAEDVYCRVIKGGELCSRQGVALPGVSLSLPAVTEKDLVDLDFLMKEGVDFIALSFVRRAEHIDEVRRIIAGIKEENPEACTGGPCLIAKIENEEGFKKRGEILAAADGIMVARGDLGVEVPPEEVPLLQESLIELANRLGKPVITATEMLESMVSNPRPTRAEVTDIAHAIISGTDAVMLSAETAVGRYPVQAVEMMARVARRIESSLNYAEDLERRQKNRGKKRLGVAEAISHATCQIALDLGAQAIITATQSGGTARMVSMYRPRAPILAATPNLDVARVLSLSWGVTAILVPVTTTTETTLDVSVRAAVARRFVKKGDLVVITGGLRTGIPGTTNLLQVHEIEADARDAVPMEEPAGE
jgi:pyruvate kinase